MIPEQQVKNNKMEISLPVRGTNERFFLCMVYFLMM